MIEVKVSQEMMCKHCGGLYYGRTCCGHDDFVECFETIEGEIISIDQVVKNEYIIVEEFTKEK